jgi:hypothetical protein
MAEAGITHWEDVTNRDTGGWMTWKDLQRREGGSIRGAATERAYTAMRQTLGGDANAEAREAWAAQGKGGSSNPNSTDENIDTAHKGDSRDNWAYEEIGAARRAPQSFGGWEYLIKWEGQTERTWTTATNMSIR